MKRFVCLLCLVIGLVSCAKPEAPMHIVMQNCSTQSNFSDFVFCLKANYKKAPNSSSVLSFYAQLDAVLESYDAGELSETKARARAYEIYDTTIGADNIAQAARTATYKAAKAAARSQARIEKLKADSPYFRD
jgi:hypothetical protein